MIIFALLLVLILFLSVFLSVVLLPRVFLTAKYGTTHTRDRGIKRRDEVNGTSLVFEPEEKWREYINQYALVERKGKKQLVCKLGDVKTYLEYDVAVFDCLKRVIKVLRVKDFVDGSEYTKEVNLPEETSYVSISIIKADNQVFKDNVNNKIPFGKSFAFLFLTTFIIVAEIFMMRVCLANLFGGVYRESFLIDFSASEQTISFALEWIAYNLIAIIVSVKFRHRNLKGRKNA